MTLLVAGVAVGCSVPTGPGGSGVVGLRVSCPSSVLVGQTLVCTALAVLANGLTSSVNVSAVWSTSDPGIATVSTLGGVTGVAAGSVVIFVAYQGHSGSSSTSVQFRDAVEVDSFSQQGTAVVGSTVTLTVDGFYCVMSEATGRLSLVVTDQSGKVLGSGGPNSVSQGGRSFVLPVTFTIPSGATEACLSANLQVGQSMLTSPSWPATVGLLPGPCLSIPH